MARISGKREDLIDSIATRIVDYRKGEIPAPDPAHVERWISQFDEPVQEPILAELDHVLEKTYITKPEVETFLTALATGKLAGDNPDAFWKRANFLRIQLAGNSQVEMLAMFDRVLQESFGFGINECGSDAGPHIYLDEVIFTGNRVKSDLTKWIQVEAPPKGDAHVVVIAFHRGGQYYAATELNKVCTAERKSLKIAWWRCLALEDRKAYVNNADVLRPTMIPRDALTQSYVKGLKYPPVIRQGNGLGEQGFFKSDVGRCTLEREFLKAGLLIRSMCPDLNVYQRPLGNMLMESLGFGALLVTFRNCPNNAPLALWAGNPWYPLFPRKTN